MFGANSNAVLLSTVCKLPVLYGHSARVFAVWTSHGLEQDRTRRHRLLPGSGEQALCCYT